MRDENDRFLERRLDTQEFILHLSADQGVKRRERFIQKP